jgi:hypothetical protein
VDTKAPNTNHICKAYANALNRYPLTDDFFQSPMQPNSPDFTYPKWEEFDIYEHKDIYLRIVGGRIDDNKWITKQLDIETYEKNKTELEKDHLMEDNSTYKDIMRHQN